MFQHEEDQNTVKQFLNDTNKENTLTLRGCKFIAYYLNPLVYICFSGLYFYFYLYV